MADVPRVDELFSRAVVAQLAEQRAQRETFTELERKVERLEALISTRFSDMSRLLRSGEVELRLEVLEEEISGRFARIEQALASATSGAGGLEVLLERLERVEDALRADDAGRRLTSLELSMAERLGHLEESVRGDDHRARLEVFEREMADRIARLEEIIRTWEPGESLSAVAGPLAERLETLEARLLEGLDRLDASGPAPSDLSARLESLEGALGERFGHLEETVRTEDIGRRLKALELAIDERSGRLEELARTSEVERRLEELARSVDERLSALQAALDGARGPDPRVEALDQAVAYRLTRLEGILRRMEEQTASRLQGLADASAAAEVGILERIIAESQVVAEHFQAVRPAVMAASTAGPDLERALGELRRLARSLSNGETTGSHPVLELPSEDEQSAPEELFLPPEETPIPERRFGGLLPRRDR